MADAWVVRLDDGSYEAGRSLKPFLRSVGAAPAGSGNLSWRRRMEYIISDAFLDSVVTAEASASSQLLPTLAPLPGEVLTFKLWDRRNFLRNRGAFDWEITEVHRFTARSRGQ